MKNYLLKRFDLANIKNGSNIHDVNMNVLDPPDSADSLPSFSLWSLQLLLDWAHILMEEKENLDEPIKQTEGTET